ncbi:MAG: adenylate/guanylate cyclase domain-containing protein, partial [Chloroflexota bacterium]|nr:adenylate/guanylate cyclase domain-containing protein [Chloroflexota bacterium]
MPELPGIDASREQVPDSSLPSERRLVSVLFVDLENFTALSESMDPEDVRGLQSRYFEVARAAVARYGGTLEKFIGDAVMAVWGAPSAHEDDG